MKDKKKPIEKMKWKGFYCVFCNNVFFNYDDFMKHNCTGVYSDDIEV